jgi:hypothetical protein
MEQTRPRDSIRKAKQQTPARLGLGSRLSWLRDLTYVSTAPRAGTSCVRRRKRKIHQIIFNNNNIRNKSCIQRYSSETMVVPAWKAFINRFQRKKKNKKKDKTNGERNLLFQENQGLIIPSEFILLSDALDDNPIVMIGKEATTSQNDTITPGTTAQPALISPDSTSSEVPNNKNGSTWTSRWESTSDDISDSSSSSSPSRSRNSNGTSTEPRSNLDDNGTITKSLATTTTTTPTSSTVSASSIPQLLQFVEEQPQQQQQSFNTSFRSIGSHSTIESSTASSTISDLNTTQSSTKAVLLMEDTSSWNHNNISTQSGLGDTTTTTSTTTGDSNTLVSSLYYTSQNNKNNNNKNQGNNNRYYCNVVAEEEEEDDEIEDLEILRRICCSTDSKDLVHILGEQYSCLYVDDQMKGMVRQMLQKQQQQEEAKHVILDPTTANTSATTKELSTEPLEHLGFEAELLN